MRGQWLWAMALATVVCACTPAALVVDPTPVTLQLALTQIGGALYTSNSGSSAVDDVMLSVNGQDLRVNDSNCTPAQGGISCKLASIPVGRRYVLPFAGTVRSAAVRYVRAGQAHISTGSW